MTLTVTERAEVMKQYQRKDSDTGSPEVQVALITERIKYLTEHFKTHKKDKHSRYGLQRLVNQRKKLLKYLKRKDKQAYQALIQKLGLRDSY